MEAYRLDMDVSSLHTIVIYLPAKRYITVLHHLSNIFSTSLFALQREGYEKNACFYIGSPYAFTIIFY